MSVELQQWIAFVVVGAIVFRFLTKLFSTYIAPSLAQHLLKRGQVKLAMKLRHLSKKESGCTGCS